tara:strand:+ start:193 stop:387 length:195 start_codon:yes stop_codon:yes gene_type:complete
MSLKGKKKQVMVPVPPEEYAFLLRRRRHMARQLEVSEDKIHMHLVILGAVRFWRDFEETLHDDD